MNQGWPEKNKNTVVTVKHVTYNCALSSLTNCCFLVGKLRPSGISFIKSAAVSTQ